MRKVGFRSEEELREIADRISQTIVEKGTDHSPERRRKTNYNEQTTLYKLAYGALLSLNVCHSREYHGLFSLSDEERAILKTVEFIFLRFFPKCQSYVSIYTPLWMVLEQWCKEDSKEDEKQVEVY